MDPRPVPGLSDDRVLVTVHVCSLEVLFRRGDLVPTVCPTRSLSFDVCLAFRLGGERRNSKVVQEGVGGRVHRRHETKTDRRRHPDSCPY